MNNFNNAHTNKNNILPNERFVFNYGNNVNLNGFNSFESGQEGGNAVPDNQLILNNDTSDVLFSSDFSGGFDTLYDWVLAFNNSLVSPSRNTSVTNGNDSIGAASSLTSDVPISIDCNGAAGTVYDLYSNHFLKIKNSGRVFCELSNVYQNFISTTNTTTFSFEIAGVVTVQQADWNIDTFDASSNLNPSTITLDFTKKQTLFIEFDRRNRGDVLVGFVINNTFYYAHRFQVDNQLSSSIFNVNLPVRDTIERTANSVIRKTGIMNDSLGLCFVSTMDTTSDPTLVAQYLLSNACVYSVGSSFSNSSKPFDIFVKQTPSSGTSRNSYINLSSSGTFETVLLAVRPNINTTSLKNRTVYGIDKINIQTRSLDLNNSVGIKIFWNYAASGTYYPMDGSGLDYSALEFTQGSSVSLGNAEQLIYSGMISANQNLTLDRNDLFKNNNLEFSNKSIDYPGGSLLQDTTRGTVAVLAILPPGSPEIDVAASISGYEIA